MIQERRTFISVGHWVETMLTSLLVLIRLSQVLIARKHFHIHFHGDHRATFLLNLQLLLFS